MERPAATGAQADELARLGAALERRSDAVARDFDRRVEEVVSPFDDVLRQRFEQLGQVSISAFAAWLAGHGEERARQVGAHASTVFGQLAAQREASLKELTKACLRWRDAMGAVLREVARVEGVSTGTLDIANEMLSRSTDVTLVRMCDSFEHERRLMLDELHRWEEELVYQATHDSLTGLPNRASILDRTRQGVARARRNLTALAVIFIDLDDFKNVNDTYGHSAGDELLRSIARRLEGVLREEDALGRLGGDEFVIVAESSPGSEGPEVVAARAMSAVRKPFEIEGLPPLTVTASLGIALGPGSTAEELLREADVAMYRAKWSGKNRYLVFDSHMNETGDPRAPTPR